MNKIKILRLLALVCAVLLCITACGVKRQEETSPTPIPTVWLITAAPTEPAQETEVPAPQTAAPAQETVKNPAEATQPAEAQPAATEPAGETPAEATPDPARFIKINTSTIIRITKHPGGEVVRPGDSTLFTAKAEGIVSYEWRFVSPEYDREVLWNAQELGTEFPGLRTAGGATFKLELFNIPSELNGWYAVCLFADAEGGLKASDGALIQVSGTAAPAAAKPAATPTPTEAPAAAETPMPTEVPAAAETPTPTEAPAAAETPTPTEAPASTETPAVTPTATPSDAPGGTPENAGESGEAEGGKG